MADPAKTTPDRPAPSATTAADGSSAATLPDPPHPTPSEPSGAEVRPGDTKDPLSAEQPGRYLIRREHGRGGQAVVYLAFDSHVGRELAFKQLLPHSSHARAASRFLREARVTGQLEHPGIVPVYELGRRDDGSLYYTQKLVRGRTLHAALAACRSLADRLKLLSHFVDVCQALAYAHGRGVVHRDIKPENVMVGEFGETVVLDWGLAKVRAQPTSLDESLPERAAPITSKPGQTAAGTVLGTPLYMSPEQAEGRSADVDERSDVWGLGAMLFEILAGRPPFEGSTAREVIWKVTHDAIPEVRSLAPEAPPELIAVAERALRRDRALRYATARELAAEVEAWMSGDRVLAYEYSSWELVRRFVGKNKLLSAVSAAAIATLLVASAVIAREHRASTAHLAEARQNLAEALIEKARHAERALQWPRAAAYYAASRVQHESTTARWGQAFTARLGPRPILRIAAGQGPIWSVTALADGRRIATAGGDGTVRVFDATTGRELARLAADSDEVSAVAASPSGNVVASGGSDGNVRLWDLGSGSSRTIRAHEHEIWGLAWSRDGKLVATGAADHEVRVWEAASGARVATLRGHGERVTSVAFGANGELASASFDGTVRIYGGPGFAEVARHEVPGLELWAVAWSPDGQTLAVGGAEGLVRLFPANAAPLDLDGHERDVTSLAFSPDGITLASSSRDGTIRLWDARSGRGLARADGHQRWTPAIAFLPGGDRLVSGSEDETALIWSLPGERAQASLVGHGEGARTVAFSPDGRTLASGGEDNTLRLWDVASGHELARVQTSSWVRSLSFSREGLLAAGSDDHGIRIYDAASHRELRTLLGHTSEVNQVDFAPSGPRLASGSDDGTVRVWDASSGRELVQVASGQGKVRAVGFSPDGKRLASAGVDGTVRLWDAATGAPAAVLRGHGDRTRAVAFSPDGKLLASGGNDRDILVWDLGTGGIVRRIEGHEGQIRALAFLRDGTALASASADRSVVLWDVATGERLVLLARHGREVLGLAVSPDGRTLATASRDRSVDVIRLGDASALAPPAESLKALLAAHRLRFTRLQLEDESTTPRTRPSVAR